jgi:hypothetical protein
MIAVAFPESGVVSRHAIGGWMHRVIMIADALAERRRFAGPMTAIVVAAFAAAPAASAWVSVAALPISAPPSSTEPPALRIRDSFFDLGFSVRQVRQPSPELEIDSQITEVLFAPKPTYAPNPTYENPSSIGPSEPADPIAAGVPVPRPRRSETTVLVHDNESSRPEDPTVLQKLSGLFRYRLTLASLTPNDGIFRGGPDLAALGYDSQTAVYDISAHMVYLPRGSRLEAHSGFGDSRDDPLHVSEPKVGATPPAVYELKPREQLFHGVQALRMLPVEGSALGRTGLLVHSYMLGPNGDSNGCVSIRDYDSFLAAYQRGDIKRLAVVPNLAALTRQSSL